MIVVKWVYYTKQKENGDIDKYKAQLLGKAYFKGGLLKMFLLQLSGLIQSDL